MQRELQNQADKIAQSQLDKFAVFETDSLDPLKNKVQDIYLEITEKLIELTRQQNGELQEAIVLR